MKKITYFFRPLSQNVSIERVFNTVSTNLPEGYSYEYVILPNYLSEVKGFFSLIKAFFKVREFCKKNAGEINHITGDIHYCAMFLPYSTTVLTIHDTVSLENLKGIKRRFIWLFWYFLPLISAKNITCISPFTARKLIKLFPWAKRKITIIPNPIGLEFKYSPKLFNKNNPIILHIGTRSNKNLDLVIQSLKGLKCHLRIIGKLTKLQLNLLLKNDIIYSNEEFISNNQVVKEYENCDIVSFPSIYEGFGLPIIEGQMIGRVVLTSNIFPMDDVAGEGAFLVNPSKLESINDGFTRLISDDVLRQIILEKAQKNVVKYLPAKVVNQYCQIYDAL
ncbi:glycosyltransferase [Flavobacterium sp. N2820]|uniref:glycosyltransferase n=1 Tax=Flavobacterium sp. N2820 TaxID=2986834 RepID=UPI002224B9DF|nr:glycosyltransferase [Flavobacterium sp. N2820]